MMATSVRGLKLFCRTRASKAAELKSNIFIRSELYLLPLPDPSLISVSPLSPHEKTGLSSRPAIGPSLNVLTNQQPEMTVPPVQHVVVLMRIVTRIDRQVPVAGVVGDDFKGECGETDEQM